MSKFNTESAFGGGVTGASYGGTAAGIPGAIIGGVAGFVSGGLFGGKKKKKPKKLSTLDANQQNLYDQYSQGVQGQGPMADLFKFDPEQATDVFNKLYAKPAYQKFQEEVVPGITGAFRGKNLQNSSYLGGALAKAGTDVQNNLNANMSNMIYKGQQDSISRRIDAVNNILNTQTFAYQKDDSGSNPWDQAFSGLASGAGKIASKYALNKMSAGTK